MICATCNDWITADGCGCVPSAVSHPLVTPEHEIARLKMLVDMLGKHHEIQGIVVDLYCAENPERVVAVVCAPASHDEREVAKVVVEHTLATAERLADALALLRLAHEAGLDGKLADGTFFAARVRALAEVA